MRKIILSIVVVLFLATNQIYGQININYFANIDKLIDNKSGFQDFDRISDSDFFIIYNNIVFTFKQNKYVLNIFQNENKIFSIKNITKIDKVFWSQNNSVLYLTLKISETNYLIYSFNLNTLKLSQISQNFYEIFDFSDNKFYFKKENSLLAIFTYDITNSSINKVFEFNDDKYDNIYFFKKIENSEIFFIEAEKYDGDDYAYVRNIIYNNQTKEKLTIDMDYVPYDSIVAKSIINSVPQLKKFTNNEKYRNSIAHLLVSKKYNYCCKEHLNANYVKGFFIVNNIKKAEFISLKNTLKIYVSNQYTDFFQNQIFPYWLSVEIENNLYRIFNNSKLTELDLMYLDQISLIILEKSIYFKNNFFFKNKYLAFYFNSYNPYYYYCSRYEDIKYSANKTEVESRFTASDKHNLELIDKFIVKVDLSTYSQQEINQANKIIDIIDTLSESIYTNNKNLYNNTFQKLKNLVSTDLKNVSNNKELLLQSFLQRTLDIQGQNIPIEPKCLHYQARNTVNSLSAIYGYKFGNKKWLQIDSLFSWYKPSTKTPAFPPDVNNLVYNINKFEKELIN